MTLVGYFFIFLIGLLSVIDAINSDSILFTILGTIMMSYGCYSMVDYKSKQIINKKEPIIVALKTNTIDSTYTTKDSMYFILKQ